MPLRRIGGTGDGAYLVPDDLHGIRVCYSPGVADRKHFEDQLLAQFGIDSQLCDRSANPDLLQTPLMQGRQHFRSKWLDINGADDSITLWEWVDETCPDPGDDLILQMDIEGAEYRNLLATPAATLSRFRIIVIELHALERMADADVLAEVMKPLAERLTAQFTCVHVHPNNCCGDVELSGTDIRIPRVLELTFLRNDRFGAAGMGPVHAPLLPHPEDIVGNLRTKPPLFLDDFWRGGPPTAASRRKMLRDRLAFLTYALAAGPWHLMRNLRRQLRAALRDR